MSCRESVQTASSLQSWQKKQQRQERKLRKQQQSRRDWDRDYRCQFVAAVILGAIGAAVSCIGAGLIVYGLPTADRLQREMVSLTKEEAVAAKVSLMLYGRLGGLLLGVGLFLLIVLAVLGTEYRQHLRRQRSPSEDARTIGRRRLYADILRGLRFLWQDSEEAEENHDNGSSRSGYSRSRRGSSCSRRLPVAAVNDAVAGASSIQLQQQHRSRANSMLQTAESPKREGEDSKASKQQEQQGSGLLRPSWRANEAFDASDETAAFKRQSPRSAQSMRMTARDASAAGRQGGVASLQQLFSVELEFSRFSANQNSTRTSNLELTDLVDNDFEAAFASHSWQASESTSPNKVLHQSAASTADEAASKLNAQIEPDGAPEF